MVEPYSVLRIEELGTVPTAYGRIRQALKPLPNGDLYHDVWGRVHATGRESLNLFQTTLTGEGIWPPMFGGLWRGRQLTLHSVSEFPDPLPATPTLVRPAVPGSVRYLDAEMRDLPDATGAAWMNYRPVLQVYVRDWDFETDDDDQVVSWTLDLWEGQPDGA